MRGSCGRSRCLRVVRSRGAAWSSSVGWEGVYLGAAEGVGGYGGSVGGYGRVGEGGVV